MLLGCHDSFTLLGAKKWLEAGSLLTCHGTLTSYSIDLGSVHNYLQELLIFVPRDVLQSHVNKNLGNFQLRTGAERATHEIK